MSQRAALLISTALAVLTLLGGIGLAARVMGAEPYDQAADQPTSTDTPVALAASAVDAEELERLQSFNEALKASYVRITALLETVDQLRSQNAALRERESVYEERLAEANRRLADAGRQANTPAPTDGPAIVSARAESPADAETAEAAGPLTGARAVPETAQAQPAPASAAAPVAARTNAPATSGSAQQRQPALPMRPLVTTATSQVAAAVQSARQARTVSQREQHDDDDDDDDGDRRTTASESRRSSRNGDRD
jgi:hypothetical protein